jgi:hypothetical protein
VTAPLLLHVTSVASLLVPGTGFGDFLSPSVAEWPG